MKEPFDLREQEAYAFLRRGREPYATACLRGKGSSDVTGELFFYDTPAGVMISAEVRGLSKPAAVYGFCFCEEGTCGSGRGLCRSMPLIYDRNGQGKGSLVTERLCREPLIGRRITLRESVAPSLCGSESVAEGIVEQGRRT